MEKDYERDLVKQGDDPIFTNEKPLVKSVRNLTVESLWRKLPNWNNQDKDAAQNERNI